MGFFWGSKDRHEEGVADHHSYRDEPHDVPLPPSTHQSAAPSQRSGFFSGRHRRNSDAATAHTGHTSSSGASTVSSLSSMTRNTYPHQEPTSAGSGGRSLFRRNTEAGKRGGVLHRTFGNGTHPDDGVDPSIQAARERVMSAEAAERDADRALDQARLAVREARDHVRQLELEAKEEARKAKIKQYHAREVSKRGKALGRHDPTY